MSHDHIIAREGWGYIFAFLLLTGVAYYFSLRIVALVSLLVALFSVFFFRNPKRKAPGDDLAILAPADGRILAIETVNEDIYLKSEAVKISIFLSLFNVHINRVPIKATVDWTKREGFSYLAAYKKEAADTNVRNYLAFASDYGRVLVVQITGFVARRLVCWVQPGDRMASGSRFGLIKFGSCTEVYIPKDTAILVEIGQRVRGGETIIGRFDNQKVR